MYATKDDYQQAVTDLTAAADAYYQGTGLTMADADYDAALLSIQATEEAHPDWVIDHGLLNEVAAGTGAGDVPHSTPMLSLGKTTDTDGLAAWYTRLQGLTAPAAPVTIEPKLDGIALAARYENGTLTTVLTRGDGRSGENVTNRIPTSTLR